MITTVTPFKGRHNYLRLMLATLAEAARGKDVQSILVQTDEYDEPLPDIVHELPFVSLTQHKFLNVGTVLSDALNYVFGSSTTDWVLLLDSDMILHPLALEKAEQMVKDLPDMGYGSIFNTEEHPDCGGIAGGYVRKNLMGYCATIIKRSVWRQIDCAPDDIQFSNAVMSLGLGVYCTETSYAEHLGFEGFNRRGDEFENSTRVIDRARRFMDC